jgi:two-component sensor histidine kinase
MPLRFLDDLGAELESALQTEDAVAESEHRIANNLAIIAAMVRSAIAKLKNDPVRDYEAAIMVLADLSTRIEAVAQLHRMLVEHGQNQVELATYLREVVRAAKSALTNTGSRVAFDSRTQIRAHPRRAAAMGLFLSEAITNALKHAKGASVRITLRMSGNDLMLDVIDNGPGLPASFDERKSNGFRLMRSLASRLHARVEFVKPNGSGLCTRLIVPPQ